MAWIKVGDRLPPDGEEVWAFDADDYGVIIATHSRYGWHHLYGDNDGLGDDKLYEVTHWQPFMRPGPPGEVKRNDEQPDTLCGVPIVWNLNSDE